MKKRIIALLLCCVMLLTLSPSLIASASADDATTDVAQQSEQQVDQKDETKDETKDEAKDETKDETKDEAKDETKDEAKDETKDEAPAFDVKAAYDALMACTTAEDMIALSNKLTDEQIAMFSDEQIAALNAKYDALMPEAPEETDEGNGIVNFTDVAPFLDPVSGSSVRRAARAANADEPERVDNAGVVTSKTVSDPDKDGNYTITLESFVTGKTTTTETTTDVPTDIVLVLDQSGSMEEQYSGSSYKYEAVYNLDTRNTYYVGDSHTAVKWCSTCNKWTNGCYDKGILWWSSHHAGTVYTPKTSATDTATGHVQFYTRTTVPATSKLQALKDAVTAFKNSVADKAKGADGILGTKDDVNHRIAVVGFASGGRYNYINYNYGNTEVFVGSNQYKYGEDAKGQYGKAFQSMNSAAGLSNVNASIGALSADGGTLTNLGIEMANGIFAANTIPAGEKRNRVMIVFTDGIPGWNGYDSDIADSAIRQANTTKKTYGATVYTIGIFSGADATSAGNIGNRSTDADKGNYFLQRVSSNTEYPQTPSYYLTPSDGDALDDVFQQISDNISTGGASVKLDSTTVVKDVISDYFELPEGADKSDINVYTAKYTGTTANLDNWATRQELTTADVTISEDGKTIDVKGFNFAENYVGIDSNLGTEQAHGAKLIIEFKVKARDGFLGGNGVPTNGTDSGIYSDGTVIENFERPTTDVAIPDITVTAADKNVYLRGALTEDQLKADATAKNGSDDILTINDWRSAFVTIGTSAASGFTNLTEDQTYTLSVTVTPKNQGTVEEKTATSNAAKINVFTPELTFKDSTAYYGDNAPAYSGNLTSTKWKHKGVEAEPDKMIGTAPELTIGYAPETGKIDASGKINTKQDIKVSAKVEINGADVTNKTTFVHQACDPACSWNVTAPNGNPAFLIHVKTCQLTITKTGGAENEPYVFTVKKDGQPYTEVTIVGNNNVTIYELPVGTYTIEENTKWSWRFDPTYLNNNVKLSAGQDSGAITCTNKPDNNKWLNGFSDVVTNTFDAAHN